MAGRIHDHLIDDVTCPVFLFGTVTPLSESIKLLGIREKQQI